MNKNQKQAFVTRMNSSLKSSPFLLLFHQTKMTVEMMSSLRCEMRQIDAEVKIGKNKLVELSLEDTDFASMKPMLKGPVAMVLSDDPVTASKVLVKYSQKNKNIQILGAGFGAALYSEEQVKQLSKLPTENELRGKLVMLLRQPGTLLAGLLQRVPSNIAQIISAHAKKMKEA